jgi:hypothetical protein
MRKKGAFDIQNYLITFIFFIGIMATFGTVAYQLGQSYKTIGGSEVDDTDFQATYNQLGEIETQTKDLEDKLTETQTGTKTADTQFLGDALNSLKLIIPSMAASTSMIISMAGTLGIPPIWMTIFSLAIVIMILTVILYMIFKSRGTS